MGLTSGERSALWRKRQREDPLKHEDYKRKERDRYRKRKEKGQIRAVDQMTDREKRGKRRMWRKNSQAKRDREKKIKVALTQSYTPPTSPEHSVPEPSRRAENNRERGRKRKNLNRSKAYRDQFKLRVQLNKERRLKNKYKKRYYRLQEKTMKDDIEGEVGRIMTSRKNTKSALTLYCILTRNLRQRYSSATQVEKRSLKNLIFRESILCRYRIGSYAGKRLGISEGRIRRKSGPNQQKFRSRIHDFYNRDDNSRIKAGSKSTVTKRKMKMQVRLLNDSVINLHHKFNFENQSKINYSLFARLKPCWVRRPNEKDRETCLCKIHENPTLKMNKLYSEGVTAHKDLSTLIKDITCNNDNQTCMYRQCSGCNDKKISTLTEQLDMEKMVDWKIWKTQSISRVKEQNGETTVLKSKATVKLTERTTIEVLVNELQSDIERLARHEFKIRHQYRILKQLKDNCNGNELILHIDFSENYLCKYTEEIQSVHFGASKKQISIHTGVAYMHQNKTVPFATLSDNLQHNPVGIWAHLDPIIRYLKEKNPELDNIHVISDGPTTQYRNKTNFCLFSTKLFSYGFSKGSWNLMEAGHGKGAPDGIGAVMKRQADSLVNIHNQDITCSSDLIRGLCETLKSSILMFEIKDADFTAQHTSAPSTIKAVPETMKLHQVTVQQKGVVSTRILSCFCADNCSCFSPVCTQFTIQVRLRCALSLNCELS